MQQNSTVSENILDALCSVVGKDASTFRAEIRTSLTTAGLFLLGYELLRASIVDGVKDFYQSGWVEKPGEHVDPAYHDRVLARVPEEKKNRKEIASAMWLHEAGALTASDVRELKEIWKHRNELAHELPSRMLSWKAQIVPTDATLLRRLPVLLDKVDRYWANLDMDLDEHQHPVESYEQAITPRALLFAGIFSMVTGAVPAVPEVWRRVVAHRVVEPQQGRPARHIREGEEGP